jgi:hypothetical protein
VILRAARFIPTILDDVFTAARAAFARQGYLTHAADYGSSLTFSHPQRDHFGGSRFHANNTALERQASDGV